MTPHHPTPRARLALAAVAAAGLLITACGDAEDAQLASASPSTTDAAARGVEVTGAWARTSPKVASAGAVFLTIANPGAADDALVGVSVDPAVAATAEIHETVAVPEDESAATGEMGGSAGDAGAPMGEQAPAEPMMTMRPVDRIAVPAGGTVALEPGGYHVMLLDLAAPLQIGAELRVTLVFEQAGEVVVTAEVRGDAP